MPLWFIITILGVVEGITEFLPVSSTGHLLIAERWLHIHLSDVFNIVIQSGAVLAVLPLFRERLRQFFFNFADPKTQIYAGKIVVAFLITGIGGFILDKKGFKLPEELKPVAVALFLGGVGFLVVEAWLRGRDLQQEVTWTMSFAVGLGQLVAAVFPGTSRSGITILLCLILGLNRPAATEFCFLVGIPTMLAAGAWKVFKALHHPAPGALPENWAMVSLGFVVSAVVSFIVVRWLLRYVQTHTFALFGWYRIGLAALIAGLLLHG
jgi:undecaprenyl-diphosphatase